MGERDAHALTEDIMKYEMRSFFITRDTELSSSFLEKEQEVCKDLLMDGIAVKPGKSQVGSNVIERLYEVIPHKIASFNTLRTSVQKKRKLFVDVLKFMCPRFKELQQDERTTNLGALVDKEYKDIKDDRIWPNNVFFVINNGTEAILNQVLKEYIDDNLFSWQYILNDAEDLFKTFYPNKAFVPFEDMDLSKHQHQDEKGLVAEHIIDSFKKSVKEHKTISLLTPLWNNGKYVIWNIKAIKKHKDTKNECAKKEDAIFAIKRNFYWGVLDEYADNILRDMLNVYVSTTLENGYFHPQKTGIDASKEAFMESNPSYFFDQDVIAGNDLDHAFEQIGAFLESLDIEVEEGPPKYEMPQVITLS